MLKLTKKCVCLLTAVGVAALFCDASAAFAQSLGAAASFGAIGSAGMDASTGGTVNGDAGVSPLALAAITGFPPGVVTGTKYGGNIAGSPGVLATAAMNTLHNFLKGMTCPAGHDLSGQDLIGQTLTPGVWCFAVAANFTANGTLTLDAQHDPNAVFVIKVGSTLTTHANDIVSLVNGADPANVYWDMGTASAILGATNQFKGNIVAAANITLGANTVLTGRALAGTDVSFGALATVGAVFAEGGGGGGGGGGPLPACQTAPTISNTIPNQVSIPVNGTATVNFTISGASISNALRVSASSSNSTLVPHSAMVITTGAGGARTLSVSGADGRSGTATITVTVTDPNATACATSMTFQLTVGAAPVPTLPQWAMIALTALMAFAGFVALRRRTI